MLKKNLVTRLRYASENVATAKTMSGVCVFNAWLGYDCERYGCTLDECSKQCLSRIASKLADEVETTCPEVAVR